MILCTFDLIIFDVDGTLVRTKSCDTFRRTADDWELLPGRRDVIQQLLGEGRKVVLASNQGGCAFGHYSPVDMRTELERTATAVGALKVYACFTHPEGTVENLRRESDMRKPGPGMLLKAMKDAGVVPEWTLMVGDRPEDEQAAKAAGCHFLSADEFFALAA